MPPPASRAHPSAIDDLRKFLADVMTALAEEGVPEATRDRVLRRLVYGHPAGPNARVTVPPARCPDKRRLARPDGTVLYEWLNDDRLPENLPAMKMVTGPFLIQRRSGPAAAWETISEATDGWDTLRRVDG